jgi:hypothetical protein
MRNCIINIGSIEFSLKAETYEELKQLLKEKLTSLNVNKSNVETTITIK